MTHSTGSTHSVGSGQARSTPIIIFFISAIIILSVVQTIVSNRLSTSGIALGKIEDQIRSLKMANAILGERLFKASALTTIVSKASELGFVEDKSQLVLTKTLPLALKQ